MTAPLNLAANRLNADTAGQTNAEPQPHTTAGPTLAEVTHQVEGFDLGGLFAGGIHPEAPILHSVSTALARATDSVRGPLGGLTPRGNGTVAPGPAAAVASAQAAVAHAVESARPQVNRLADRIRGLFRA